LPPIERAIEQIVSLLPGYEPRPQQIEMGRLITDAIKSGRHALIEAGTGSGKSFGYLIPLLESGKTAVISTGTIALQEQLLYKDLPFLAKAYGREIKVALGKGRSNYICLRKLAEANQALSPADPHRRVVEELVQITRTRAWTGDRAELPFNVDSRFWADMLASDPEDCLGPKCANFVFTPHRTARLACDEAQIVIANHALYFADQIREAGILPKHDVVVFDEAHHLDRAAVSALSVQVSRWMGGKLLQRVQRRFSSIPLRLVQAVNDSETELVDVLYRRGRGQFPLDGDEELGERAFRMSDALSRLAQWVSTADAAQMTLLEVDPGMAKQTAEIMREQMQAVAADLAERWAHFAALRKAEDRANWMYVDPGRDHYELQSAPLDVGEQLEALLWSKRTCILTSATLAVDGKFDFYKRELGLPDTSLEKVLGSPFDYPNQALFYVPRGIPMPNEPKFNEAVCPEIERILTMTEGRAFVLCTSYRSLREIAGNLAGKLPYPCKTQEDLPRARLVEWFRSTPNAVLFATATFWEGVDIPGEALSCVIIDKLPFANPDDPVVQARTERMKARGEDWFGGYMLPKAVLALKQGFGRLIRTRTDRGIVALLDRRVLTMRYGEIVLRSLPPARRLHQLPPTLDAAFAPPAPERKPNGRAGVEPPLQPADAPYQRRSLAPPPDLDAVLGEPPL
jgi:ATP-dependent DNA helicase DinG